MSVRMKKWWWAIFAWLVEVAIQNAWILYRKRSGKEPKAAPLLEFRRAIANFYLRTYGEQPRRNKDVPFVAHSSQPCRVQDAVRLDGRGHWPISFEKPRRCAVPGCTSKRKSGCGKCNVALCKDPCFELFHTQKTFN